MLFAGARTWIIASGCSVVGFQQSDGSKKELILLDPKRSNAINIGLTTLPPARTIRTAIFKMDNTIIGREQIEVYVVHIDQFGG